ncbi:hypothetical protein Tco_0323174 [Tanacetum coccineum]
MARTPLNENCSAVILNKLPKKLGDPGRFFIPCEFSGINTCNALADLGASIILCHFVWKNLSLSETTPTCMTLNLRTVQSLNQSSSDILFYMPSPLGKNVKRCEDTNLVLTGETSFMVKEGIVLGPKSHSGIEVPIESKVDVIAKLPSPTSSCDRDSQTFMQGNFVVQGNVIPTEKQVFQRCQTLFLGRPLLVQNLCGSNDPAERISKKRTKNEAKRTKSDTEWKSMEDLIYATEFKIQEMESDIQEKEQKESQKQIKPSTEWKEQSQKSSK